MAFGLNKALVGGGALVVWIIMPERRCVSGVVTTRSPSDTPDKMGVRPPFTLPTLIILSSALPLVLTTKTDAWLPRHMIAELGTDMVDR